MVEIRISKFLLLLTKRSPCRLVVQFRAPVCSCLLWPARYKTRGSFSLPAGNWDMGQYSCSFPEPLRVPLPEGCRRVKVVLKDALRTVATFMVSTAETCCPSSSSSSSSHGVLYYQVGPVEGGGDSVNNIVVEGEAQPDMKCHDTCLTGNTGDEGNVLGARAEYPHIQIYDSADQEDDLHDQNKDTTERGTCDSADPTDDVTGQTEDLSSEIDEILSSEDTEKAFLTEEMLRNLAERMYETGCLTPQDQPSILYDQLILFLVVATVASVIIYQWFIYILFGTAEEEDEPLIDL